MSIRTKVIGFFLVVLTLFIAVSAYNYVRFRQANDRLASVNELFLPFSRGMVQLQSSIFGVAEEMRRFYFHTEPVAESSNRGQLVRDLYPYLVNKRFDGVERMLTKPDQPELKTVIGELDTMIGGVKEAFERLTRTRNKNEFDSVYLELRTKLQAISRRVDDECQRITMAVQAEGRETLISNVFLSTVVAIFGLLMLFLSHRVLKPLPRLIESVKRIADGDFNQSLKVSPASKDEVSLLAREYNRMLACLSDRDKKILNQQKELLQSERLAAVGQLSAEVVHEIRNPLNSISLNIDWLDSELTDSKREIKKTLKSMSKEIERLNLITESYLVRARLPVDERPTTPVHELLEEIIDFCKEEHRAKNIDVETELAPNEIYLRTDRARLKQAFLNVMKNAKEAMPRGGRIVVRTEVKDNVYRIQFCDSGYGMNASTRRQTFQPFYTTKPNGTGLGLVLTKTIVEEAQGSINCDSQMGEGTTFTLQFPV